MRVTPTSPPTPAPPAGARARRRRAASLVLLALLVVGITFVSLSDRIGRWWERQGNSQTSSWPRPVRDLLSMRLRSNDVDVHVVLWCGAGAAAVLATKAWRVRVLLLVALVGIGGLIELGQLLTKVRTAQWGDFVGDAAGVGSGAVLTLVVLHILGRRRRPMPSHPPGQTSAR